MVIHSMMGIQTKWVCESPPKVGQFTHVFDHDTCVCVLNIENTDKTVVWLEYISLNHRGTQYNIS